MQCPPTRAMAAARCSARSLGLQELSPAGLAQLCREQRCASAPTPPYHHSLVSGDNTEPEASNPSSPLAG